MQPCKQQYYHVKSRDKTETSLIYMFFASKSHRFYLTLLQLTLSVVWGPQKSLEVLHLKLPNGGDSFGIHYFHNASLDFRVMHK